MNDPQQSETVVVVGAGIIGIACAHYLSTAGLKVTVIDKGSVAGACSYGNCGYICPSHVLPLTEPGAVTKAIASLFNSNAPFRVKLRWEAAFWRWMWQFTKRCNHKQVLVAGAGLQSLLDSSINELRQIVAELSLDCEWRESGLVYVLQTSDGMKKFAPTAQLLEEQFGVSARRIAGDELTEFDAALKPGLAGAFHYEGDACVRPDRLTSTWVKQLRRSGVEFIENCELEDVHRAGDRIQKLETSCGSFTADHFVLAAGAWSTRLARCFGNDIPVEPGKGYSITMKRPAICPRYPMLFPEHHVGITPFADGYRLGSMMEFVGFDASIPDSRIRQLQTSAESYLVEPYTDDIYETWQGWRPMTWDSLPIIGRLPNSANAFVATGHNMLGMSLATGTGRLISELVTRQQPHLNAEAYSPNRF